MLVRAVITGLIVISAVTAWVPSQHLDEWYQPWELCTFHNATDYKSDIKRVGKSCNKGKNIFLRCIIGGVRHGLPCGGSWSVPLSQREHLKMAYTPELDNPSKKITTELFSKVAARNGSISLLGDSQMTNIQLGMECNIIREKLHPFTFNGINSLHIPGMRTVKINRFNDGFFKISVVKERVHIDDYVLMIVNFGTHYNHESTFVNDLNTFLPQLNEVALEHAGSLDIVWMETPPQHWNSSNGYWPGKLTACVPLKNTTLRADWRNYHVHDIIKRNGFTGIKILKLRDMMRDLWNEHHRGDFHDCTHYCDWPMLYRDTYEQLIRIVDASSSPPTP